MLAPGGQALVAQGEVWVNGKMAVLRAKVTPGVDKVTVGGKIVRTQPQPRITLAVNKPRGLICSNDDPHNPETIGPSFYRAVFAISILLRRATPRPKDGEALVILTTDGDLANRLMHPSSEVMKALPRHAQGPLSPRRGCPGSVKGLTFEGERTSRLSARPRH